MRPQEFLHAVRIRAAERLPPDLRGWTARVVYATLQVHYGNPRIHYEVWLVHKTGRIEIGLHIEADRETSRRWAAYLAAHADEIRASLGTAVELEDWTASWSRLHETVPLVPLDERLCARVAERLARLIAVTHPLLVDAGAHVARPRIAGGRRRMPPRTRLRSP